MRRTSEDTATQHTAQHTAQHTSIVRHVTAGLVRIGAAITLLAVLVALPIAVVSVIGMPQRGALSDAFSSGRLDDTAIVQIGTVLFLVLWAWFAATAIGEVVRVAAWRGRAHAEPLESLSASPTGWVRRLVRVAMVSTTAAVGSGLITVMGMTSAARVDAAAAPAVAVRPTSPIATTTSNPDATAPNSIHSTGRDTPYSIAVRLGDPLMRDRIIELNRGTTTPSGATWTNGVFPAGMSISVPDGSLSRQQRAWTTYTVGEGDSVYRIAGQLAANDGGRVREVADEIIGRNMGRVMNDGSLFEDPSLIRVGWAIDIPVEAEQLSTAGIEASSDETEHTVVHGESYWSIAEDHLLAIGQSATGPQIMDLTDELIDINDPLLGHDMKTLIVPGDQIEWPPVEVSVPAAAPEDVVADPARDAPTIVASSAPAPVAAVPMATDSPTPPIVTLPVASDSSSVPVDPPHTASDDRPHTQSPITASLGAAVLLCAGALGLVESRRRHQLRRAPARARLEPPTDRDVATERLLRTLPVAQRALRLDLALRSAGHHLAGSGAHVLAVTMTEAGTITLILHRPERATPATPWQSSVIDPSHWELGADVDTDDLIDSARLAGQPCPALVHLGTLIVEDGVEPATALFVDLEAYGLLSVDGRGDTVAAGDIVRAMAASLAASPVGETLRMVTHDLAIETHLGNLNAESAETIDAAIDCAAAALGSTPTAIGGRRTFELRARGVGGEAWEPVVVVSGATTHDVTAVHDLVAVSRGGGRGLAAVLIGPVDGAELTLTADPTGWTLAPLGLRLVPIGLPHDDIVAVHDLLDAADRPLADGTESGPVVSGESPFAEAPWQLVVRVLGQVSVADRDGNLVAFDRGKAMELAAWLSLHRERPTRAAARTALWDLQVRDATFANVVSDARRAMGRAVTPPVREEWIERTLTEQLPLHALVTSDADLLRARLLASRGLPAPEAIDVLRPGVEWIADLPFAGTGYLWPDAEGITSSLTLLATAAATELARHCLTVGDIDGVFWATGRGLQVLSGHEELIGLRMRAYAQRGDLAGVRSEWEVYERAIHADPWSSGEPSPKLVAIRRELLSH